MGDLERVEDNRGQITLGLGGAGKVCELALLEDATQGLGRRGPGAALLLEAKIYILQREKGVRIKTS